MNDTADCMDEPGDSDPVIARLLAAAFPAASTEQEVDDDFLSTALANHRRELRCHDLERIDQLRKEHQRSFPVERMRHELHRIIDRNAASGFDDVVAKASVQLAKLRRRAGEHSAARISANRAVELSRRVRDFWTLAMAHFELGMVIASGEEAELHFSETERYASMTTGNTNLLRAKAQYGRARARCKQGDLIGAVTLLIRSLEFYRLADDEYGCARALARLGYYQRLLGQFEVATETLESAREAGQRQGFERVVGYACLELGNIARAKGRNDEALASLRLSRALFAAVQDLLGEAHALAALAVLQRQRGELDDAIDLAASAHKRYKERDLREVDHISAATAFALRWLGECLCDARQFTEAEQALDEALRSYRVMGHLECLAMTLSAKANLLAARGDVRAALVPALEAVDWLAQIRGVFRQGTDMSELSTPHISCYLVAAEIANQCSDDNGLFKALSGAYQELVLRGLRVDAMASGAVRSEMLQLQGLDRAMCEGANEPTSDVAAFDPTIEEKRRRLLDEVVRQSPNLVPLLAQPFTAIAIVVPADEERASAFWMDEDATPQVREVALASLR